MGMILLIVIMNIGYDLHFGIAYAERLSYRKPSNFYAMD